MHCLIEAGPIEILGWIRVASSIFRIDWQGCQPNVWHGLSPAGTTKAAVDETGFGGFHVGIFSLGNDPSPVQCLGDGSGGVRASKGVEDQVVLAA